MNEIRRRLMNGYVELTDGTFAKEVNGELIPVHEDEACAFEPEMFLDDDDDDEDFSLNDEASLDEIVQYLHTKSEVRLRRKAYLLITNKKLPKWWNSVVSASAYDDFRVFGKSLLAKPLIANLLPEDLAVWQSWDLGARTRDFMDVDALLWAMQCDLNYGCNEDVIRTILNGW